MEPLSQKSKYGHYSGYIILFIAILLFCINFTESISVDKFLFEWGVNDLVSNYHNFSVNFLKFASATMPLHSGDSESGWRSFYFLLPLFLFLKLTGGLSLYNLHLFTVFCSIFSVIAFYFLLKKYWGIRAASIAVCFLAFSFCFQEISRSGTYHAATILVALILIIFLLKYLRQPNRTAIFLVGVLSGLSWYYYGPIRFLLLASTATAVYYSKNRYKHLAVFLFGAALILLLGFILTALKGAPFFDEENIFYQEPGYQKVFYMAWLDNARAFWQGLTGNFHDSGASLMNKFLIIPLIAGIIHIFRNLKYKANAFLAVLFCTVCIFPVFVTYAHWQFRRYVLYCIPLYALVGIGGSDMVSYIRSIGNRYYRRLGYTFMAGLTLWVISSELVIIKDTVWHRSREDSFLSFGREIKRYSHMKPLFYLQEVPHRLYEVDSEAALLTLVLERKYQDRVYNIDSLEFLGDFREGIYIAVSPYIEQEIFLKECENNNLNARLIASTPYNAPSGKGGSFRLYVVKKQR